jgi:pimeloyl-ACP methyl ester carboxylesterase
MIEERVPVSAEVDLFVARCPGPAEKTLLVIHGGPCWDHTYLREPLVQLTDRQLIFPDLRGCGRSTGGLSPDQYTPDLVIDDLTALLDHLGLEQVDVLGFSYGGMIAQRLALKTGRVGRLIVASSSVPPVPLDAFHGWRERDERLAASPEPSDVHGAERNRVNAVVGARTAVWREETVDEYLRRIAEVHFTNDWDEPYLAGILPSPRYPDALERFAALGLPMLLLHGRQDMTFPAALTTEAAKAIPSAQPVILDEAGHMAHIDQPVAWLQAVKDFLA